MSSNVKKLADIEADRSKMKGVGHSDQITMKCSRRVWKLGRRYKREGVRGRATRETEIK